MSSWLSGPAPPLDWRMPTTWNGMPPIVMSVPTASARAQVGRRRRAEDGDAQAEVVRRAGQERALPDVVVVDRRVAAVVPTIDVVVFCVAGDDERWVDSSGATAATPGTSATAVGVVERQRRRRARRAAGPEARRRCPG